MFTFALPEFLPLGRHFLPPQSLTGDNQTLFSCTRSSDWLQANVGKAQCKGVGARSFEERGFPLKNGFIKYFTEEVDKIFDQKNRELFKCKISQSMIKDNCMLNNSVTL